MKTMGKREKFLLSFFIAVVFLLVVQYICSILEYNVLLADLKQLLSGEKVENGIDTLREFFMDTYDVDINSEPGIVVVDNIKMVTETLFNLIGSVITLTTVIYLIIVIKINNFKEYWKDLFKAFLIILAVFLFVYILSIIHDNFLVVTSGMEFPILSLLGDVLMGRATMLIANLLLNYKKLKFNKNKIEKK